MAVPGGFTGSASHVQPVADAVFHMTNGSYVMPGRLLAEAFLAISGP
jgi:hypothetical protein